MDRREIKNRICVGILAHVDAGKTTLTENLLFGSGAIRKMGRVDHRDTFLDTDPIERERGITVFSKLARMTRGDALFTILDTPGHADLSPEMERTLYVLDYAILIISAADKITAQDKILWRLLESNKIPTFIFVNKMDSALADKEALMKQLQETYSDACIDFSNGTRNDDFAEAVALTNEQLLNKLLEGEPIDDYEICEGIGKREIFPVYFGAALKNKGIDELLDGMRLYMTQPEYNEKFGARIFKISRDARGLRLAWMKITGGSLAAKQNISYALGEEELTEKADQIRLYSGESFEVSQRAYPGDICAVSGLSKIVAGSAVGSEKKSAARVIEPVLTYEIEHADDVDTSALLKGLRALEEEEPKLNVRISEKTGKISVNVMGPVQMEVLKRQLLERFGISIGFGKSTIIYKETVAGAVVGVGHFEPLRHYAEVRLLIEPLDKNSGVQIGNLCAREELEPHWQRLILSHLLEKNHTGVLTDSELTDVRISLLGGRAHVKHTVSGDFRQATFRAIRQGLMEAQSVLLEPVYDFTLTLPEEYLGRALYDLSRMNAQYKPPQIEAGEALISGRAAVSALGSYQEQLSAYSSGQGRLSVSFAGYETCHNTEDVIQEIAYDPEADIENPAFSVFCSHGAGVIVPWYAVKDRMHTDEDKLSDAWNDDAADEGIDSARAERLRKNEEGLSFKQKSERLAASEKELQDIFERTYGSRGEARQSWKKTHRRTEISDSTVYKRSKNTKPMKEYLLVDGYNIIFAWDELKALAARDIGAARDKLMDILSDYQAMTGATLILVFDAYKVSGGRESVSRYHNIHVVYTRESETADQYIEKTVHEIAKSNRVTVATSDGLEQMIILGSGAARLSALGLIEAVKNSRAEVRREYLAPKIQGRSFFGESISDEIINAVKDDK